MKKLLLIILILSVSFMNVLGQSDDSDYYYVNTIAGLGYSYFLTDLESDGLNRSGLNGTLRFMWQPEHLLRIGLETGFTLFYTSSQSNVETEYGVTDIETKLTGVPIFAVYSMQVAEKIELNFGTGIYILYSTVDSHGNKVTSNQVSTGFMISGNYFHPINESMSLGGELKWSYVNKIDDTTLALQFVFKYALLQY